MSKVLAWIDSNGGIHVDNEIYNHFIPMFKFKGAHRDISKAIERLEEVKKTLEEIVNKNTV